MKQTADTPDTGYDYVNTLYYQTRKNRFGGCNKDKLRKLLAMSPLTSTDVLEKLLTRGWVSEAGSDVLLTEDGWRYITGVRRDRSHATVQFTSAIEQAPEREAIVYKFEYNLRDNAFRQYTQSVTVSISNELCRQWQTRRLDEPVNDTALVNMLRRYAFDCISQRLMDNNLRSHEQLQLGPAAAHQICRYQDGNIPGTESLEYEVEWIMHNRA